MTSSRRQNLFRIRHTCFSRWSCTREPPTGRWSDACSSASEVASCSASLGRRYGSSCFVLLLKERSKLKSMTFIEMLKRLWDFGHASEKKGNGKKRQECQHQKRNKGQKEETDLLPTSSTHPSTPQQAPQPPWEDHKYLEIIVRATFDNDDNQCLLVGTHPSLSSNDVIMNTEQLLKSVKNILITSRGVGVAKICCWWCAGGNPVSNLRTNIIIKWKKFSNTCNRIW